MVADDGLVVGHHIELELAGGQRLGECSAQQGQAAPFGFLDPALYTLANTGAVHQLLPLTRNSPPLYRGTVCGSRTCGLQILTTFDDQSFTMFGYTGQVSRKGYSNMSGIGTPNGQAFIAALRATAP